MTQLFPNGGDFMPQLIGTSKAVSERWGWRRGRRGRRVLLLLPLLLVASTCGVLEPGSSSDLRELTRAKTQWEAARLDNYDLVQQRLCYCTTESTLSVVTEVRDGGVRVRRYLDSGVPVPQPLQQLWGTVDDLFELVADAIDQNAASLLVTYHPTLGYPTHISIDYLGNAADDELTVTASLLHAFSLATASR